MDLPLSMRATELFPADSDRVDEHVFGWPLTEIRKFDAPIPHKGAQGFWIWAGDMARELSA